MLKKIVTASLTVGTLVTNAPVADATSVDVPRFACDFTAMQHDVVTGQSYEGEAYGFVLHLGDPTARMRCYIRVNGVEASTTPIMAGVIAARLTFTAHDTDVVTFHADACVSHGPHDECFTKDYETKLQKIPPQEITDFVQIKIIGTD